MLSGLVFSRSRRLYLGVWDWAGIHGDFHASENVVRGPQLLLKRKRRPQLSGEALGIGPGTDCPSASFLVPVLAGRIATEKV